MVPIITVHLESIVKNEILTLQTNMTLSQFNVFRKIIVSEVPTLAMDLFEISENDSILCDEVLIDRISLVPIRYAKHESLIRKDLCDCSIACEKCSIMITFEGKQGNWLMSNDISELLLENVPIIFLSKTHKVKFNTICTRGIASWHSKWNLGVNISMRVIDKSTLRVILINTGTYSFDYILREALSIMQSKLNVKIIVQ